MVSDPGHRAGTLAAYVDTYLKEESTVEALVRNRDSFIRMLHAAGLFNGQILNLENLARESEVKRTAVERYFQILEDTLLATWVPAGLATLLRECQKIVRRAILVYQGTDRLIVAGVGVLPVAAFLEELHAGKVI